MLVKSRQIMDDRSRQLSKILIQRYIIEGQPISSQSLPEFLELNIYSTTIRNLMSGLESMGLIRCPHKSSVRFSTTKGCSFFIDNLLTMKPLKSSEAGIIDKTFESDVSGEVISHAADLLSNLSDLAEVDSIARKAMIFRQVEFLHLNEKRLLLILIMPDGEVLNKILKVSKTYSPDLLTEAVRNLTSLFFGLSFFEVQRKLALGLKKLKKDLSGLMLKALEEREAVFSESDGSVVMSCQKHLFNVKESSENADWMKRVHQLLKQKSNLAKLLDSLSSTEVVTIFIGGESSLMQEKRLSLVATPFGVKGGLAATLGVIGSIRMLYERIISIIDITACVVSVFLSQNRLVNNERKVF